MAPTTHILETLRKNAGLSRDRLGAAAGVTSRCILSVEREGRTPRRKTAEALAEVLGVDAAVLRLPTNANAPAVNGGASHEARDRAPGRSPTQ